MNCAGLQGLLTSQNSRRVPGLFVWAMAGMRYVWYPPTPLTNTSKSARGIGGGGATKFDADNAKATVVLVITENKCVAIVSAN